MVQFLTPKAKNLSDTLDNFIAELGNCPQYFGQPITVLVGGSLCFYRAEPLHKGTPSDISKLFDWIDFDNTLLKVRHLKRPDGKRIIYYAGIAKSLFNDVRKIFEQKGIPIEDFIPASLLILENWIAKEINKPIVVKFPGQAIWLAGNEKIVLLEKSFDNKYMGDLGGILSPGESDCLQHSMPIAPEYYSFYDQDVNSKGNSAKPLFKLFSRAIFRLNRRKGFFDSSKGKFAEILTPIISTLRIAVLTITGLSIIFSILALPIHLFRNSYDHIMNSYQKEAYQKSELQVEISALESKLQENSYKSKILYAGALSAFCQERPSGLYLKEMGVLHDQQNNCYLQTDGFTNKENLIFDYIKQISKYTGNLPLEVTQLKKVTIQNMTLGQPEKHLYAFKIKLSLGMIDE
ncbi:MAG: hypothetical protein NTV06_02170 [candidate division Zixibacteria bacterium]|nr:hypothetical protein [candidate division Zixibacteria bacterium]